MAPPDRQRLPRPGSGLSLSVLGEIPAFFRFFCFVILFIIFTTLVLLYSPRIHRRDLVHVKMESFQVTFPGTSCSVLRKPEMPDRNRILSHI